MGGPQCIHLPNEVLTLVFAYVYKSDLKSIRLVSRLWGALACVPLFDRVYISPRTEDIEVFRNIVGSYHCRSAIKELVYDTSHFDEDVQKDEYLSRLVRQTFRLVNREDWVGYTEGSDPQIVELLNFAEEFGLQEHRQPSALAREQRSRLLNNDIVNRGFHYFCENVDTERSILDCGEFLASLCIGLASLCNLERVIIDDHWEVGHNDLPFNPSLLAPMRPSGSPFARTWHPLFLQPSRRMQYCGDIDGIMVYHTMVRALSLSKRSIRELYVYPSCFSSVPHLAYRADDGIRPMVVHNLNAFRRLQVLHLPISVSSHHVSYGTSFGIHRFLTSMEALRELDLHFDIWDDSRMSPFSFKKIFGETEHTWPHLTSLALAGIRTEDHELLRLLKSHSLRNVKLCDITLTKGYWPSMIENVRLCLPGIEVFEIAEPLGDYLGSDFMDLKLWTRKNMKARIEKYILHGGPNPLRDL
ncbi:hypothetical protein MMC24_001090 [Lignoscripta atroalba]|nr:hypothetical protein [Lignoscripta atroalba]